MSVVRFEPFDELFDAAFDLRLRVVVEQSFRF
jgi:hypothetical protein